MNFDIKAVLFDMDGVLVESEVIMRESAKLALKDWGLDVKDEDFVPFIGSGEVSYLGGAAGVYGVPYEVKMKKRAYEIYGELIGTQNIAYENSAYVVKKLRELGYKTAVCTSADSVKLALNLKALKLSPSDFTAIVTGDDIIHNKPAPDIYLKGAAFTNTPPENCLVCEDAQNGITAAQSAGMVSCGFTTFFDANTLRNTVNPDFIIESINHFFEIPLFCDIK